MIKDQTISNIFTIEFRINHIGWSTWKAFFTSYEEAKEESLKVFSHLKSKDIRIACFSKGIGYLQVKG